MHTDIKTGDLVGPIRVNEHLPIGIVEVRNDPDLKPYVVRPDESDGRSEYYMNPDWTRHVGRACGLNASWCVRAWHLGGREGDVEANNDRDGGLYILDNEDGTYMLVLRIDDLDAGFDHVETLSRGSLQEVWSDYKNHAEAWVRGIATDMWLDMVKDPDITAAGEAALRAGSDDPRWDIAPRLTAFADSLLNWNCDDVAMHLGED